MSEHRPAPVPMPSDGELVRKSLVVEQAPPVPSERPAIWTLVFKDMQERHEDGCRKYGTPLQTFNGRKPLTDLYQELLDAVVYTRQEIEERKAVEAALQAAKAFIKISVAALPIFGANEDYARARVELIGKLAAAGVQL